MGGARRGQAEPVHDRDGGASRARGAHVAGTPGRVRDPAPAHFARLGVGVGLVAGIVPGILLYRRYRSWRTGERPTLGAPGPIGATAFWLLVGAALWSGAGLELVALIVVLVGLPPSLVVASRG